MLTLVDRHDDLGELAPGWERLERAAATPMQTATWMTAAAQTIHPTARLEILIAGDPADPIAIAPFVRREHRLEFVGAAALSEPGDLLCADHGALEDIAAASIRRGRPLLLRRLPAESPTVDAFAHAARKRAMVHVRTGAGYPVLTLDDGWAAPEGKLEKGRASDMRRARRHAAKQGETSYEFLSPTPAELDPLLDEAIAVEACSWKAREGSALAQDPERQAFIRTYAAAAAARGELRLCFMRIDGKAVAMQLAIEWHERLWLIKIGYDETYKRCSPGQLLLLESARWSVAQGLAAVEFLGAAAPWTEMWTRDVRPCATLLTYPARPRGLRILGGDLVGEARRRREAVRV